MNLRKKKELAKRTLKTGKKRIIFLSSRLDEIKEIITKKDIRDLQRDGAIIVQKIKGRKTSKKKYKKRGPGKIKKRVNKRKQEYVKLTRKLRRYVAEMKNQGQLSKKEISEIRKKIRNKDFKSKTHLKEHIKELK